MIVIHLLELQGKLWDFLITLATAPFYFYGIVTENVFRKTVCLLWIVST
jgi:hypothetical protein